MCVAAIIAAVTALWRSQLLLVQRPARLRAPALLWRLEDARAAAARAGQGRRCSGTDTGTPPTDRSADCSYFIFYIFRGRYIDHGFPRFA